MLKDYFAHEPSENYSYTKNDNFLDKKIYSGYEKNQKNDTIHKYYLPQTYEFYKVVNYGNPEIITEREFNEIKEFNT
jgi:hypothetical protein